MLPAPVAHLSRVRDARTEPVRLPETEQVLAAAAQVHTADTAAGAHGAAQAQGEIGALGSYFFRVSVGRI